tara:strand:+ start:262 stop:630 length:369 start_codon:yes stop_codon:yes gene_type:complete
MSKIGESFIAWILFYGVFAFSSLLLQGGMSRVSSAEEQVSSDLAEAEEQFISDIDGSRGTDWSDSNSDSTYEVQDGDSLGSIAQDRYGDLERHRMIYEENRDRIVDPDRIYPGQKLVLPNTP